jgi:hypothetical protein
MIVRFRLHRGRRPNWRARRRHDKAGDPGLASRSASADRAFILALCDFGHAIRWYCCPVANADLRSAALKEGAMTQRNLTGREDRFIGICLAALTIVVVFAFILSTP